MGAAEISLVIGGIVTVVGAIVAGILSIITAINSSKDRVTQETQVVKDKIVEVNNENARKLDNITILVDGRYSEVLRELAEVRQLLADKTEERSDQIKADVAKDTSDKHSNRLSETKSTI